MWISLSRSLVICFVTLTGMTMMYCGVKLTEWSDFKTSFSTIEFVNNYRPLAKSLSISKLVARNTKDEPSTELLLNNNSSIRNISHKPVSMKNKRFVSNKTTEVTDTKTTTVAITTTSPGAAEIKNLYDSDLVLSHGVKLQWIRHRMMAMASTWTNAARNLSLHKPSLFRKRKSILIFPGLLLDKLCPNCEFAERALKGGPVGELVQWTDLIVSLYMLRHNITIVTTPGKLETVRGDKFDVIITDYIGLEGLMQVGILPDHYCKVRVLDTFGSEPLEIFNAEDYKPADTEGYFTKWKFQNTKQFWNLYPHTPDNSFLGFAMDMPEEVNKGKRENMALIYGKKEDYMAGRENYLAAIGTKLKLHSTFTTLDRRIPKTKIENHGIVDHTTLSRLLQTSKLFIGLGFPYEGPGPLQALANGCPYIQPHFVPPRGRKNEEFFKQKPTTRTVASQNAYLEDYVGEPYAFTVDASDMSAVKKVVDKVIKRGNLHPYIPYEFTQQGMMERVGVYVIYQDFCRGSTLTGTVTTVTARSEQPDHPASHAVDDDPKAKTCYHSSMSCHSWWEADLGSENFIREISIQLKIANVSNRRLLTMSLRDSAGFNRTHEQILKDDSNVLSWSTIETVARYVRIDFRSSVPDQLILCTVDIYGMTTVWPKPSLLKVIQSKDGESCTATCASHHMLCEYSFFPLVNTFKTLNEQFNCKSMEETRKYMDVFPSYVQSEDKDNGFVAGSCVTTKTNPLLSCSGHHQGYLRLCPCREYRKGQVALPIEL